MSGPLSCQHHRTDSALACALARAQCPVSHALPRHAVSDRCLLHTNGSVQLQILLPLKLQQGGSERRTAEAALAEVPAIFKRALALARREAAAEAVAAEELASNRAAKTAAAATAVNTDAGAGKVDRAKGKDEAGSAKRSGGRGGGGKKTGAPAPEDLEEAMEALSQEETQVSSRLLTAAMGACTTEKCHQYQINDESVGWTACRLQTMARLRICLPGCRNWWRFVNYQCLTAFCLPCAASPLVHPV